MKKIIQVLLIAIMMSAVTASVNAASNALADFSASNPSGQWSYYYDHYWYTWSSLILLENYDNTGGKWYSPGDATHGWIAYQGLDVCKPSIGPNGNALLLHNGVGSFYDGQGLLSVFANTKPVLQWKASKSGRYAVNATYSWYGSASTPKNEVRITRNYAPRDWDTGLETTHVFNANGSWNYADTFMVSANETIEFWGGYTPGDRWEQAEWYGRDVLLSVDIVAVPEPASVTAMCLGLVGLIGAVRRRR